MLLREVRQPEHPLRFAACIAVLSFVAAVVFAAGFFALVGCE